MWTASSVLLLTALALAACSEDDPSAPDLHALWGHVRLTGFLVDPDGRFAGTRVVGDADGVLVELLYGNRVIARTTTVDGVYGFAGLGPGAYVARAHVIGDIGDETLPLTISSRDLAAADTLRLVSRGDLYPVPNPSSGSTSVFYEVAEQQVIEIRVLDLAGATVRILAAGEVGPGLNLVIWDGRDANDAPVTATMYWVTFVSGSDVRAQLLFR